MKKIRGFEIARGFEDKEINLPQRQTKNSAGYDFESAEDITIPSMWKTIMRSIMQSISISKNPIEYLKKSVKEYKPILIKKV